MKLKSTLIALLFAGFAFAQIQFPQASNKSEIEQTIGFTKVEVDYYRPNLNNRSAFGGIVPFGEVWRTGANNNTTIEFNTDVLLEGKPLLKGKYSLYTIPTEKSWNVIFYKNSDNWGNPKTWDESQVALKVTVPVYKTSEKVETFTIGFDEVNVNSGKLVFQWDITKVKVNIDVPTHQKVLQNIQTQLNDNSSARDFYSAANYYYMQKLDLKKAKEWIDKALAKDTNSPEYFTELKSKIESELKKK
ncbi:MAG: DUF2911 domain-containing protein [Flavobacteriaceae bacterium]|nr:DUF2911 domain-containing protein [Candidatus Onthonaster equi]